MTADSDEKRPRILVADDDPDIRELISFRLSHAGYEVSTAKNGEEAVALAHEGSPDLVVLDVMMPKLDGLAATRQLRESEATRSIPIILLTARVQEVDMARGFEAGANDYLTKPFSPQELRARVQAALEGR